MKMNEKHQACEPQSEEILYKIGMFASMNHVTVKALRFYEERGLLEPAFINFENGYRYYKLSQCQRLHQITALKQAGFTLEEIMLMNSGADEESVLLKKKSELLATIAELTRQVAAIDGYQAKQKGSLSTPILIKKLPSVTVAYMADTIQSYDDLFDIMPAMGDLMERVGCTCAIPEYCFTNYLEQENNNGEVQVEICQSVVLAKDELEGLMFKEMPEVQVASAFHKGSYDSLYETYEMMLKYIEKNGYVVDGPIRECYIDGIWNQDSEKEWLTEIQIPIQ